MYRGSHEGASVGETMRLNLSNSSLFFKPVAVVDAEHKPSSGSTNIETEAGHGLLFDIFGRYGRSRRPTLSGSSAGESIILRGGLQHLQAAQQGLPHRIFRHVGLLISFLPSSHLFSCTHITCGAGQICYCICLPSIRRMSSGVQSSRYCEDAQAPQVHISCRGNFLILLYPLFLVLSNVSQSSNISSNIFSAARFAVLRLFVMSFIIITTACVGT